MTLDTLTFTNPDGLYDPRANGCSHLARFPAGWRTKLSSDFRQQFAQAVENTRTVLAAAGATLADTAKIDLLIVDQDRMKLRIMTEEVARVSGDAKPAMTLVLVPELAIEGMQVEIDVIAVVPPTEGQPS